MRKILMPTVSAVSTLFRVALILATVAPLIAAAPVMAASVDATHVDKGALAAGAAGGAGEPAKPDAAPGSAPSTDAAANGNASEQVGPKTGQIEAPPTQVTVDVTSENKLAGTVPSAGTNADVENPDNRDFKTIIIFAKRDNPTDDDQKLMADLGESGQSILQQATDGAKKFDDTVKTIRSNLGDLRPNIWKSRERPGELEDILSQLRELSANLNEAIGPIAELQRQLEDLIRLGNPTADTGVDSKTDRNGGSLTVPASAPAKQPVAAPAKVNAQQADANKTTIVDSSHNSDTKESYIKSYNTTEGIFIDAQKKLEGLLNPAQNLLAEIDAYIAAIEKDLPVTWRNYYFRNTGTGGLTRSWQDLTKWFGDLPNRTVFLWLRTTGNWSDCMLRLTITDVAIIVVVLLVNRAGRLPARFRDDKELMEGAANTHRFLVDMFRGPGKYMAMGAILLSAASHDGGNYLVFRLPGIVILIHGLSILSWRLRLASWRIRGGPVPSLAKPPALHDETPSPLSPLNKPAGVGIALLFIDPPIASMTIVWAATLLIFVNWLMRRTSKSPDYSNLPLAERLSYGNTFVFAVLSLLVTLAGFARLAILAFMLLYTLVNIIILGSSLVALTARGCQILCSEKLHPVKHSMLRALAIPVSFMVSLITALPWLWSVPGSLSLLYGLMNMGPTFGTVSLNFGRVTLIIMIFILFRSLRNLGVTSLSHLPDTMPNLERRVIPSIQGLFTYLLWTVYTMISLVMLGFNLSSLAVVFGGLSVGVGMGLQRHIDNLISGLILIFGRSLLAGDWVEVGEIVGKVESVDIRCTVLETTEKGHVYVPNAAFMAGRFTNWTRRSERQCRRKLNFSTIYGTDVPLVREILLDIAKEEPNIIPADSGLDPDKFPPPAVTVEALSEEAVVVTLAVTITDVDLENSTKARLREKAYRQFNERGVRFYIRNELMMLPGQSVAAGE